MIMTYVHHRVGNFVLGVNLCSDLLSMQRLSRQELRTSVEAATAITADNSAGGGN